MLSDETNPGTLSQITLENRASVDVPQRGRHLPSEAIHFCCQTLQTLSDHIVIVCVASIASNDPHRSNGVGPRRQGRGWTFIRSIPVITDTNSCSG